jgi:hypothetical protein
MAAPTPPSKPPDCSDDLPNQSKWSHKDKVRLAKEAREAQDK